MALAVGTRLGPYEIHSLIGAGGMGEVYSARDTRLDRSVAIKVLPAALAFDPDRRRRFEQEARTVAALNHPHICTLHDIGTEGDTEFLVLELLEGQALRERMLERRMGVDEIVNAALEVVGGLEAAHAKRVIHRDIKPANLFLTTAGGAKILDFGLAKLAPAPLQTGASAPTTMPTADAVDHLTSPGTTIGTVAYMSPEQALGQELDARTDLFSLGVVLYEMATGGRPFQGDTPVALIDSLLHDSPISPVRVNPDLPDLLVRIIEKALEKDRDLRYQSAKEMLVDLTRLKRERESARLATHGVLASTRIPSLAVLPFANLSADKENEYFSDGLAEDIIDALAQVPGLRVMARTSAFSFRGKEVDVRKIGAELGVEHILEGSVRRSGNRLRVSAQLVNASDGYHLWSQRFDRQMTDVFAIQDEISQAIVEKLRLRLAGDRRPAVKRHTGNLVAYDLCLRARHHLLKMTAEGREAGQRYCEQAIAVDRDYALAHVVLAESCFWSAFWGSSYPPDAFARAKSSALEALRLDEGIADAHSALGTVLGSGEFDWAAAQREFDWALQLSRSGAVTRYDYAWCYAMWFLFPLGQVNEALGEMQRALGLDPLDPFYTSLWGYLLQADGQDERSVAALRHAIQLDPTFFFPHWFLSVACRHSGRTAEAVVAAEKANELSGGTAITLGALGAVYGVAGRTSEARQILEELTARRRSTYVPASALALLHAGLGNRSDVAEWVAKGVDERDPIVVTALMSSPSYGRLRSDPVFPSLIRKMNLEARLDSRNEP